MKTIINSRHPESKYSMVVDGKTVLVEFKSGKADVDDIVAEKLIAQNPGVIVLSPQMDTKLNEAQVTPVQDENKNIEKQNSDVKTNTDPGSSDKSNEAVSDPGGNKEELPKDGNTKDTDADNSEKTHEKDQAAQNKKAVSKKNQKG